MGSINLHSQKTSVVYQYHKSKLDYGILQPNWSSFYSPGPEIREYLESVVEKYKLMRYIKLEHRLTRAEYNEQTGKWELRIQHTKHESTGQSSIQELADTADVLITGVGLLSRWQWPDIQGLETFRGKVVHSAQWETGEGDPGPKAKWEDTVKGWKDKKVAVIGVVSCESFEKCNTRFLKRNTLGFFSDTDCTFSAAQSSSALQLCPWKDLDIVCFRSKSRS
jgi:hypothetical protein